MRRTMSALFATLVFFNGVVVAAPQEELYGKATATQLAHGQQPSSSGIWWAPSATLKSWHRST